jgi:hypothetical protein
MKILCLSALIILFSVVIPCAKSQEKANYNLIAIVYIGPSDSPTTSIIISDSKVGAEEFRKNVLKEGGILTSVNVVRPSLMLALISDAKNYKGVVQQKQGNAPNSSTPVSITLITPQNNINVLLTAKTGYSLLDSFKKLNTDNNTLYSALSYFQNRIRPFVDDSNEGDRPGALPDGALPQGL